MSETRYQHLREDIHEILSHTEKVLHHLDRYEGMPIPSVQMGLDLELSSLEIFLQAFANDLRRRLL